MTGMSVVNNNSHALDARITTAPIAEYLGGVFAGTVCDQCVNNASVVYVMGNCSMALCDDCRMSAV